MMYDPPEKDDECPDYHWESETFVEEDGCTTTVHVLVPTEEETDE